MEISFPYAGNFEVLLAANKSQLVSGMDRAWCRTRTVF